MMAASCGFKCCYKFVVFLKKEQIYCLSSVSTGSSIRVQILDRLLLCCVKPLESVIQTHHFSRKPQVSQFFNASALLLQTNLCKANCVRCGIWQATVSHKEISFTRSPIHLVRWPFVVGHHVV